MGCGVSVCAHVCPGGLYTSVFVCLHVWVYEVCVGLPVCVYMGLHVQASGVYVKVCVCACVCFVFPYVSMCDCVSESTRSCLLASMRLYVFVYACLQRSVCVLCLSVLLCVCDCGQEALVDPLPLPQLHYGQTAIVAQPCWQVSGSVTYP